MISSILLFAFLIQATFGSYEKRFIINFQPFGLSSSGCNGNPLIYEFKMRVITSGFIETFYFNLTFSSPSYLLAFCVVSPSTSDEEYISCFINTEIFPLYTGNEIKFADTLNSSVIQIEGWEENVAIYSLILKSDCTPSPFTYE